MPTTSTPLADQQEETAKQLAAAKAADICVKALCGASTHMVAEMISVALMQSYHQGALDALDRAIARQR